MHVALTELFTTDIGIFSLFTLTFIIGMGSYIGWYVRKHVLAEEAQQKTKP
ncbi:DUF3149 domain-containing protein [Chitinimonas sp. BJB300]|uniref:DUF3149 domain-containing protein n=1 Tax=Chitinimonas sp. BJB300 TaxID=1559339 RepID=UPI000C0D529A|nr:DUF3149 domain-containing protein [Chitinimonas sp. BJB300]PHV11449.1 hypothetical protein CSQ89_10785 [Chitinimonas sp. BJB300]TSJ87224.1 DUF3149 domain-containing protein [Chitinimonas sp. BJB300]